MKNKKEKLIRAISLADDKYIEEARPGNTVNASARMQKKRRSLIIAAAIVMTFMISLSLWLFIPFKDANADISKYSDSEYYSVIQKLHAAGYRPPRYKNNFQKYVKNVEDIFTFATKEHALEDGAALENATGSLSYKEITDNQVENVIESDIIKRTDSHIFYFSRTTLRAYSIEGEESREVGSFDISHLTQNGFTGGAVEFYLSLDGKTLTLILPHNYSADAFVLLYALDVSDPANITELRSFSVSGTLLSTRYTNGEILVMSSFSPKLDFSTPEAFVPSTGETADTMTALAPDKIVAPDTLSSTSYTVVTRLDAQTLAQKDSISLLSYVGDAYVTADTVYATRTVYETINSDDNTVTSRNVTEIIGLLYSEDTMRTLGSVTVCGYIKDQYSLDEYNGILRVATTVDDYSYKTVTRNGNEEVAEIMTFAGNTNASLWCIDLSNWSICAKVERFAPDGETVRSVRFDGDIAYVCTAIQSKDPVFFFDLSDISNITYTETGTIEGFSTSLVNFADGYLLGIGEGADGYLKIEIYEENDDKVVSVCKYEPKRTGYSPIYKSYYIDRENGLIGLGTLKYPDNTGNNLTQYTVLSFSERSLNVEILTNLKGYDISNSRGVYIDGYFYMFGDHEFKAIPLSLDN